MCLLLGLFGWKVTLLYIAGGITIAIFAGYVLGRMRLERWVEPFVFETRLHGQVIDPADGLTWGDRIAMGREEVVTILRKIWPYLLVGIALGAVIHGWVPEQWIADHASSGLWGVVVAVGLGIPLYSATSSTSSCELQPVSKGHRMDIKILGTGCKKCQQLEALTRSVVAGLELDAEISKVTDPGEIAGWGVMATPALVINGDVVLAGRVPTEPGLTALLAPNH